MSAVFELMATLGIDTSAFENGLKKAQGFSQSAFGKGLASAANVGVQAIKAAADATVSFAKSSVNAGMQFDSAMSQVGATMGFAVSDLQDSTSQAAQDMERLRNFAMEMGATTAFSATQSAEALNYMALAGYDVETSISMLPSVLDLAAAGGMDLARASDMVTDASSALGLSIEETGELVNKMAQTASKSNTSVSQLGDAILTVGGTAKDLTGGTTELAAALGILANNGIKGAEGGTALRNVLLALRPKSDAAAVAMEKIGFEAFDADGNLKPLIQTFSEMQSAMDGMSVKERQDIIASIFNKVDLKSVQAMMASTVADVSTLSAGLESAGISWTNYSDAAWMSGGGISELVNEIIYDMKTLGMSASEAQEYLQFEYDINAEDAAAAIDYVTTHIDESASVWEKLEANIDAAEGAASDMAGMQLENLEGDIKLWNSALEGAQIIISDGLTPILRDFVKLGTNGLQNMTTAFNEGGLDAALASFGETLEQGISMILEKLPQIIEVAQTILTSLGQALSQNMPMIIDAAVEIVNFLLQGIVEALPMLADGAIQLIVALANGLSDALPTLIPAAVEAVLTIVNALLENVPLLLGAAVELVLALVKGLNDAGPVLTESGGEIVGSLAGAIMGALTLIVPAAVQLLLALADGILANIQIVTDIVPAILAGMRQAVDDNAEKFFAIGTDMMEGLGEGMASWIESIKARLADICSSIVEKCKEALGIHSPSTVFAEIGRQLLEGLILGIVQTIPTLIVQLVENILSIGQAVVDGASQLLDFLKKGIETGLEKITSIVPAFVNKIVEAFEAKADSFLTIGGEYLKSFADGLKNSIANVLTIAKDLGFQVINSVKEALSINSPSAKMQEVGLSTGEGFLIGLQSKVEGIIASVQSMAQSILSIFSAKVGEFKNAGFNMMAGIGKGLESSFASVKKKLRSMVSNLVSLVRQILKISSPSKVMEEIGEYTGKGLEIGVTSSIADAQAPIENSVYRHILAPLENLNNRTASLVGKLKDYYAQSAQATQETQSQQSSISYKNTGEMLQAKAYTADENAIAKMLSSGAIDWKDIYQRHVARGDEDLDTFSWRDLPNQIAKEALRFFKTGKYELEDFRRALEEGELLTSKEATSVLGVIDGMLSQAILDERYIKSNTEAVPDLGDVIYYNPDGYLRSISKKSNKKSAADSNNVQRALDSFASHTEPQDTMQAKQTDTSLLNSINSSYFLDRFEKIVGDLSPDKYTNIDRVLNDNILRESIMIDRLVGEKFDTLAKNIQVDQSKQQGVGDIIIPVYIGNESIETIVVNAMNRAAYRKGTMNYA